MLGQDSSYNGKQLCLVYSFVYYNYKYDTICVMVDFFQLTIKQYDIKI